MTRPEIERSSKTIGYRLRACASASGPQLREADSWTIPASRRNTPTVAGLNKRIAQSMMASNTGATSVGDSLMTRRTWLIAVWYSSDSVSSPVRSSTTCKACLVSLNRRTFSIAISAWCTKDCSSAASLASNAPATERVTASTPMQSSPRIIGSISDDRAPKSYMFCSYSGISIALQSAMCRADLLASTRDGKLPAGSIGLSFGEGPRMGSFSRRTAIRRKNAPSRRMTAANKYPPAISYVVSRMASNTGCTSVGDSLMTLRIAAVAVWRASASLVSLNSRTFSIAITAWSAKVCSNCTWCGVNCPASLRVTPIIPIEPPSRDSGQNNALRQPRECATSRNFSGTSDCVCASMMCTVSPSRMRSPTPDVAIGAGKWPRSAASPCGVVGVKATRCSASSAIRVTVLEKPPSRRFALAAIASNTGCTSSGELAMTFKISAVAVWRSSASRVSFISRAFFIAIWAWVANACSSVICLSVKGLTCWRTIVSTPTIASPSISGTDRLVRTRPWSAAATATGIPRW